MHRNKQVQKEEFILKCYSSNYFRWTTDDSNINPNA